jgi:hypothetical protein
MECIQMNNFTRKVAFLLFFQIHILFVFSENKEQETEEKSLYPALLGGLFTNTVFHVTSRIFGADFAQTSLESVRTNLTSPWVWDSDAFLFNHPGHPYQGGLYHAAARSNGFSFYESIFFDSLGSLTWELFGETDIPALNDLIVTTFGGAAFGEMLHLLYLEIPFPWIGALVSPIDALNNAVLRKQPSRTHNLYYFSAMMAAGWIRSVKEDAQLRDKNSEPDYTSLYTGNIGCEVIYGDPFLQHSKKPYSQFEIKMQFGGSFHPLWLDWTLLSDGYLVSWNPLDTEKNTLSTGVSLHYDLIAGNTTNFASHAVDGTLKWKHTLKAGHLELKSHIGWTMFGSSEYYPFAETIGTNLEARETENDFGTGANLKLFFALQTRQYGILTLGVCSYLLYIIPLNKPDSRGIESFNLSFLEYSYSLTNNLSLFVNNSLYLKSGTSHRKTNVASITNRILLGVKYIFLDKGDYKN